MPYFLIAPLTVILSVTTFLSLKYTSIIVRFCYALYSIENIYLYWFLFADLFFTIERRVRID